MKRVKPGYDELLHGQCRAQEHGGRLRISQGPEPDRLNSWVSLPVERRLRAVREDALREATEAVAKARDAVVEAAKALHATDWLDSDLKECDVRNACIKLLEAERVESEARARLEALR